MRLNKITVPIYGDTFFRGDCPIEELEQVTFFNWLRREHPDTWGVIALHPRNEQKLRGGQYRGIIKQKAEGMTKGASDIIIPGAPAFVCELKRLDHTKSKFEEGQPEYLEASKAAGAFSCVALGAEAAKQAFHDWLRVVGGFKGNNLNGS